PPEEIQREEPAEASKPAGRQKKPATERDQTSHRDAPPEIVAAAPAPEAVALSTDAAAAVSAHPIQERARPAAQVQPLAPPPVATTPPPSPAPIAPPAPASVAPASVAPPAPPPAPPVAGPVPTPPAPAVAPSVPVSPPPPAAAAAPALPIPPPRPVPP